MIPFTSVGINSEPIIWELASHIQSGSIHRYEYCAPSQYENHTYHLSAVVSPSEESQHMTFH